MYLFFIVIKSYFKICNLFFLSVLFLNQEKNYHCKNNYYYLKQFYLYVKGYHYTHYYIGPLYKTIYRNLYQL
jgi:hypothetical protein